VKNWDRLNSLSLYNMFKMYDIFSIKKILLNIYMYLITSSAYAINSFLIIILISGKYSRS
jgi:hypothetical protein